MRNIAAPILLMFLLLFISHCPAFSQEESETAILQGTRYCNLKIRSLEKYDSRVERQQRHLLNKLTRRERHFTKKLKRTDSLSYANYQQQSTLSYDSITKLSKLDSGRNLTRFSRKHISVIDSVKGVQSFVNEKTGLTSNGSLNSSTELSSIQGKLNFREYIMQLITKRTASLMSFSDVNGVGNFKGFAKQVFYSKSKIAVFKEIEAEPINAEDKALNYLQGIDGFDKTLGRATDDGSMPQNSVSDLEKMGYQTKQSMQANLGTKFGVDNLEVIGKQASEGLKQWQDQTNNITSTLKQSKQAISNITNTQKPSFKVNPMRGLPFSKRIEKQFSWQAMHASSDGTRPAIVEPSLMYGFKHTPRLLYGVGVSGALGLGEGWQKIHLSFQSVGWKVFSSWHWQYGLGAYVGYERVYRQSFFMKKEQSKEESMILSHHSTSKYDESLLFGITKQYKLNKKYDGSILLLYDIWWQQKGLQTPFIIRFSTIKK